MDGNLFNQITSAVLTHEFICPAKAGLISVSLPITITTFGIVVTFGIVTTLGKVIDSLMFIKFLSVPAGDDHNGSEHPFGLRYVSCKSKPNYFFFEMTSISTITAEHSLSPSFLYLPELSRNPYGFPTSTDSQPRSLIRLTRFLQSASSYFFRVCLYSGVCRVHAESESTKPHLPIPSLFSPSVSALFRLSRLTKLEAIHLCYP